MLINLCTCNVSRVDPGPSHNVKIDSSFFQSVEEFIYLGTTLMNQNSIQEEIKSRSRSGNACYHVVQNLVFKFAVQKYED